MKILIGSNNENKLKEFKRILKDVQLLTPEALGINIDPEETGYTLEENAKIKADAFWEEIKLRKLDVDGIVSDDTGVYVEAYPDMIGVKANRWYPGEPNDRNKRLLELLENKENRNIHYRSVLYYKNDSEMNVFDGYTYGKVAENIRSGNGFAYDFIFQETGGKVISEMTDEEKDAISSRGVAIRKLYEYIKTRKMGL